MKTKILWILLGSIAVLALSQSASANCYMITPSSGDYLPVSTINPSWVKSSATIDASGMDSLKAFNTKAYSITDLGKACKDARASSTWLTKIWLYVSYFSEQMDNIFTKADIKWPGLKLLNIYSRQTQWITKYEKYDFKDQTTWDEIFEAMDGKDNLDGFKTILPKMSENRIIVWSLLLAIVWFDNWIHDLYY